jgi:hypothetical protein
MAANLDERRNFPVVKKLNMKICDVAGEKWNRHSDEETNTGKQKTNSHTTKIHVNQKITAALKICNLYSYRNSYHPLE